MAIKTNALFDAASVVNVEFEVPVNGRWSVAGEYIFPWWLGEKKQNCLQLISGNLEARYWFGNSSGSRINYRVMTGWFAGLYAGGGYYDLEWHKNGRQGEFYTAGLTGGYAFAPGKNKDFRIELSLGAGFVRSGYRAYDPMLDYNGEWHLMRANSGTYTWFGPTRAKVSLVWMLNDGFLWKLFGK
jgi:hypothetical protein